MVTHFNRLNESLNFILKIHITKVEMPAQPVTPMSVRKVHETHLIYGDHHLSHYIPCFQ